MLDNRNKIYIPGIIKRLFYWFMPTKDRFTKIYKTGSWGSSESVSGGGSTLDITKIVRKELPAMLNKYEITSMLDAPCGDFNWMKLLLEDAPIIKNYIGADIVVPLIDSIKKYESNNIRFMVADLIKDDLEDVDLILCRDCFIHLSEHDIKLAVANFKRSGAKYLLTTSFKDVEGYKDIETGRWRQINLQLPPFSFPEPLDIINEQGTNGKHLGLWELSKL